MYKHPAKSMIGDANKTVKPMPRLTLGYLELSQDEYDWLQAITRMNEDSLKSSIIQAWRGHLCRHKAHYMKKLRYLSERHGLPIEECFRRLVVGESLGGVVKEAPLNAMEEIEGNTFLKRSKEKDNE